MPRGPSDVTGKLLWIEGKWYVRLDGSQTLLPLRPDNRARGLPKGRSYSVGGHIMTEQGIPVGFDVSSISDNL